MREFLIKKLTIKNFKGQSSVFMPNDIKTFVKGANGVGKTTIYKAFCWMLTGYTDAVNSKNHELYDNKIELSNNTPEVSVKAEIIVYEIAYTIERRAKAKFSRKRGSTEWTKDSSDSYTFLIDDVEISSSMFSEWVECHLGSCELLQYMLIGERFANLMIEDKKCARKILEQVAGELSTNMMKGDYSVIGNDLRKFSIEQLIDRYKTQLKPLNQRITVIDGLIASKNDELSQFDGIDFNELLSRINKTEDEISNIDKCIADASKLLEPLICERENLIKEIHAKSVELGDARLRYNDEQNRELIKLLEEIREVDDFNQIQKKWNDKYEEEFQSAISSLDEKKNLLTDLNKQRDELVKQRDEVKSRVFNGERCVYCGNRLSEFDIDKERKLFNERKMTELASITSKGVIVKMEIEGLNKEISDLYEIVSLGCKKVSFKDKSELVKKYDAIKMSHTKFEDTDICRKIEREINDLKSKMPDVKSDTSSLLNKKEDLMNELQLLNREYGKKSIKDGIESSIKSLHNTKRDIGIEIAKLEGCISVAREYEEERAILISRKINEKLDDCRIVMYSRQKDGSLKPDCVVESKEGVKYATLNNSARIRLCLSLQRMFCKHFDINMPVFVDEASVFDSEHLPFFDCQIIYLLASDDKTLKIE